MTEKLITINCITYYKDHFCKCGCKGRIKYPTNKRNLNNHKYLGIPKYIVGHHPHAGRFKNGHKLIGGGFKKGKNNPNFIDGFGIKRCKTIQRIINRGYPYPIFLNDMFEGANCHHIDEEKVICIPKQLHDSVKHSVETGKNMDEINDLAFDWMFEQIEKRN
jgi:hypothetical protein